MEHLYPIKNLKQTVGRERRFEDIKQKVSRRKRSLQRQSASVHSSRSRHNMLAGALEAAVAASPGG